MNKGEQIKLAIEFCLEKPTGGIRFILNRGYDEPNISTNSYLVTADNQSSCWFPCIQSYNECCTWKLEITCDEELEVLASGTLIETELINDSIHDMNWNNTTANSQLINSPKRRRFHFYLGQPTCAANIGVAVGKFDSVPDSNMAEVSYHSESELIGLVKNSTAFLTDVFEFYEDLVSISLPHNSYKIVFCYDVGDECVHFSGLTIVNVNLLTTKQIIDQTMVTQRVLVNAVARQWFGCFVTMFDWHSWWLVTGLAHFMGGLYMRKLMGNNEYRHIIYQEMKEICAYERDVGYILLDLNFNELIGKVRKFYYID